MFLLVSAKTEFWHSISNSFVKLTFEMAKVARSRRDSAIATLRHGDTRQHQPQQKQLVHLLVCTFLLQNTSIFYFKLNAPKQRLQNVCQKL